MGMVYERQENNPVSEVEIGFCLIVMLKQLP